MYYKTNFCDIYHKPAMDYNKIREKQIMRRTGKTRPGPLWKETID